MLEYVFQEILTILKLIFIYQQMLAVLITLTPGGQNEFIHGLTANVQIAVLAIT
jgi:hypothetical protein